MSVKRYITRLARYASDWKYSIGVKARFRGKQYGIYGYSDKLLTEDQWRYLENELKQSFK